MCFETLQIYNHYHNQDIECLHLLNKLPCVLVHSIPFLYSLRTTEVISVPIFLLLPECKNTVPFCVWLLLLSIMHLRFSHTVAHINGPLLSVPEYYSHVLQLVYPFIVCWIFQLSPTAALWNTDIYQKLYSTF